GESAIGVRAPLQTSKNEGPRARCRGPFVRQKGAAKTLLGAVAAQSIGVPAGTAGNRRLAGESIRATLVTLFRGDRARTDGNDDSQRNRGLGEHRSISWFDSVTPSWCEVTFRPALP